jgi:hypothetical protein
MRFRWKGGLLRLLGLSLTLSFWQAQILWSWDFVGFYEIPPQGPQKVNIGPMG